METNKEEYKYCKECGKRFKPIIINQKYCEEHSKTLKRRKRYQQGDYKTVFRKCRRCRKWFKALRGESRVKICKDCIGEEMRRRVKKTRK